MDLKNVVMLPAVMPNQNPVQLKRKDDCLGIKLCFVVQCLVSVDQE